MEKVSRDIRKKIDLKGVFGGDWTDELLKVSHIIRESKPC